VEQTDLLKFAIEALEKLCIPYAIVGSFASSAWGESRFTQDIDILIDLKPGQIKSLCEAFAPPDYYVSEAAAQEAVRRPSQFNVIHPASGNKIDFMIASPAKWTTAQLRRRKRIALFPDRDADVAAPEDVILGKLLYYREGGSEKHIRDITGIVKVSGQYLDRDYLARSAAQLGVADMWEAILNAVERR
jgi:hypothetical protein